MLDLRQRASVWIATSFHQRPRVHKHANAWSKHFLPGLMSPARAQTMTSGTGELRLTWWNPHTVCCQTPVHCRSCTRNTHTTATNPNTQPSRESDRSSLFHCRAWFTNVVLSITLPVSYEYIATAKMIVKLKMIEKLPPS